MAILRIALQSCPGAVGIYKEIMFSHLGSLFLPVLMYLRTGIAMYKLQRNIWSE